MRMSTAVLFATALLGSTSAEIISDLTISTGDESQALTIKKDKFWTSVLEPTTGTHVAEHLLLAKEAKTLAENLPKEFEYVQGKLLEAAQRLRDANDALQSQSSTAQDVAEKKLNEQPTSSWGLSFSWEHGLSYSNAFSHARNKFVGDGDYSSKVAKDVQDRQADIEPVLRGAASKLGNVLTNCRLVSSLSFDILKYDIYNKGVPKTTPEVKAMADRLIAAGRTTRQEFMGITMAPVHSLVDDTKSKTERPPATVVRAEMSVRNFGDGSGMMPIVHADGSENIISL